MINCTEKFNDDANTKMRCDHISLLLPLTYKARQIYWQAYVDL